DPVALAEAMKLPLGALRFLAFARPVARVSHYKTFALPKRTGGLRRICAPMPRLKAAQTWVLRHLLAKVPLHDAAHGFRPGRSIVTNAAPDVGEAVVVGVGLADFFGSVPYPRVKAMFRWLGYSEAVATVLALLCTHA